jgi:hypothetical protein
MSISRKGRWLFNSVSVGMDVVEVVEEVLQAQTFITTQKTST